MNQKIRKYMVVLLLCLNYIFVMRNVWAAETNKYVIVLDPGHGGSESGASSEFNGVTYNEEEITWKIANYIKAELLKYPNIEVYMTRDVFYMQMGLYERVKVGFDHNADLLVSIHIDSTDSPLVTGASLLMANGNFRPEIAEKEKLFGSLLKTEFEKIGLTWRGNVIRNSGTGNTYPDGSTRDYYGIVANSVELNLPGVIVEHCFISNPSDVSKYLSSNSRIKKLAIADANAIVEYCKQVEKVPERNGWVYENGNMYYYKSGSILKNKVLKLTDGIYYLNENGQRVSGWQTVNGKTYYFDPQTEKAQKGWMVLDKKKYYFASNSGVMYQNVLNTNKATGGKRYFNEDGSLARNQLVTFNGESYYFGSNYFAVKGFRKIEGKTYYFSEDGFQMVKSKKLVKSTGEIYYLDKYGVRAENTFVTVKEGKKKITYYFGKDGIAYKGWQTINGKRYYFSSTGKMAQNTTLVNAKGRVSVFDEKGVLIKTYYKNKQEEES